MGVAAGDGVEVDATEELTDSQELGSCLIWHIVGRRQVASLECGGEGLRGVACPGEGSRGLEGAYLLVTGEEDKDKGGRRRWTYWLVFQWAVGEPARHTGTAVEGRDGCPGWLHAH